MFNEICINEEMLPKYTHTHTHTHIYIYIYIYIHKCVYLYLNDMPNLTFKKIIFKAMLVCGIMSHPKNNFWMKKWKHYRTVRVFSFFLFLFFIWK